MYDELYEEPKATELENKRRKARREHRLTCDCWHAIYISNGNVVCERRHKLVGRSMGMKLESVLAGKASIVCRTCRDYDNKPRYEEESNE